jgi:hypothetical protein
MDDRTLSRCLDWVDKIGVAGTLALHGFGEPLLHPDFERIARMFSMQAPITMSTNGALLDEKWADRLAGIPWGWISVSPWDPVAAKRATALLRERGILTAEPPGVTHNWAGQVDAKTVVRSVIGCPFLNKAHVVIRWNGDVVTCCVTDRPGDEIGTVWDNPQDLTIRGYDLCQSCHHAT